MNIWCSHMYLAATFLRFHLISFTVDCLYLSLVFSVKVAANQRQGRLLNVTSDIVSLHRQRGAKCLVHWFFLDLFFYAEEGINALSFNISFLIIFYYCYSYFCSWHILLVGLHYQTFYENFFAYTSCCLLNLFISLRPYWLHLLSLPPCCSHWLELHGH